MTQELFNILSKGFMTDKLYNKLMRTAMKYSLKTDKLGG